MLIRSIEFVASVVIVMLVLSVSSSPSTNHDTESWTSKVQVRVTVDPRTIGEEGEESSELIIGAEEEERLIHSSYQICSVCFIELLTRSGSACCEGSASVCEGGGDSE